MNWLSWNVRGIGQPLTNAHGRELVRKYGCSLCFIMETKTSVERAFNSVRNWGLDNFVGVPSLGLSGGLLLLWNNDVHIDVKLSNKNLVHMYNVWKNHGSWITCVYGNPALQHRQQVWDDISLLAHEIPPREPWLLWEDFNQVLKSSDKLSRTNNSIQGAHSLWDCLNQCGLLEIKSQGLHYAWPNRRDEENITWERFDRAFANPSWIQGFEDATIENLPIIASDHSPMLLRYDRQTLFKKRPYRFELMWTLHPGCEDVIRETWGENVAGSTPYKLTRKIKSVREKLRRWNKLVFGDLQTRKINLEEELAKVQAYITGKEAWQKKSILRKEYETILEQEQLHWLQKARSNWIVQGERNTRFFHVMTKKMRGRNKIIKIKDKHSKITEDEKGIEDIILDTLRASLETQMRHLRQKCSKLFKSWIYQS
ncbi:Endonuclease/exonuclease/phosphatase [Corchorus olitorius]|uniref:Endonuclease/exonuclease/phosphatase n=1 Tax=Corchorus olitorius TaxID=93759 RepID=A0A1R3J3H6_9ROSI|nr:Endonuclease/exonuclease/phosphatase [Corchorus olitorius]